MKTMSSVEAQNHFGLLLDTAQREPVTITRRGRPVAFILSPHEFMALTQKRESDNEQARRETAREALTDFRGSGAGGAVARLLTDRKTDARREG